MEKFIQNAPDSHQTLALYKSLLTYLRTYYLQIR